MLRQRVGPERASETGFHASVVTSDAVEIDPSDGFFDVKETIYRRARW